MLNVCKIIKFVDKTSIDLIGTLSNDTIEIINDDLFIISSDDYYNVICKNDYVSIFEHNGSIITEKISPSMISNKYKFVKKENNILYFKNRILFNHIETIQNNDENINKICNLLKENKYEYIIDANKNILIKKFDYESVYMICSKNGYIAISYYYNPHECDFIHDIYVTNKENIDKFYIDIEEEN